MPENETLAETPIAAIMDAYAAERVKELIANDKAIRNIVAGYGQQLKAASDYADAAIVRAETAEAEVRQLRAHLEWEGHSNCEVPSHVGPDPDARLTAAEERNRVLEAALRVVRKWIQAAQPDIDVTHPLFADMVLALAEAAPEPVLLAATTTYCHACQKAVDMPHEHGAAPTEQEA